LIRRSTSILCFSNLWKNRHLFFQTLEKALEMFLTCIAVGDAGSNVWKSAMPTGFLFTEARRKIGVQAQPANGDLIWQDDMQ